MICCAHRVCICLKLRISSVQVGWCWESINACVEHKLQSPGLQLEHAGLPDHVHLLLGSQGQHVALQLQAFSMVGQALLDFSPCCVSDFRPDLGVKCVCQILCSSASVGGDGVVHSVQVDGLPEHLLCYADMIFVIFFTQAIFLTF